jgi:hypothetical protein
MGSPTGALRLITRNVYKKIWTRKTSIVAAFFFVNIAGRLSVAIFGLAFNLHDQPKADYPVHIANWAADPNHLGDWIAFPGNIYTEESRLDGNNLILVHFVTRGNVSR